jgi:hypothetical protein
VRHVIVHLDDFHGLTRYCSGPIRMIPMATGAH